VLDLFCHLVRGNSKEKVQGTSGAKAPAFLEFSYVAPEGATHKDSNGAEKKGERERAGAEHW
jgi:hypothetical protein